MAIFAADFGGSGGVVVILGLMVLFFSCCTLAGILLSRWLIKRRKRKWLGFTVLLMNLLLPPMPCCLPTGLTYVLYGRAPLDRFPLEKIKKGMTKEELISVLGNPHQISTRNGEVWYYYFGFFEDDIHGVIFDKDGIVDHTYYD